MALRQLRVLEFSGLAPAPFCGMILADFGANVIKIDKLMGSEPMDVLSNGKRSLPVNLKSAKGIEIVKKLSKNSDVVLEPFRAGVMEKLGLGPDDLIKDNPRLIYARLTGFGQTGPYAKRAGHDINYLGLSGLLSLFGRSGEKPLFPLNLAADFGGGGLMCSLGILMALYERTLSGKGQVIDSNMVEGTAYLGSWIYRSQNLPIWGKERGQNWLDSGAHFYEVYETKDGKYMSVGAIEPQFYEELLKGLGIENLGQFDFDEGKRVLKEKFLEKTQDEWTKIFEGKDACVFPVLSFDQVAENKHNKERDSFVSDGNIVIPKPGARLSRTPAETQGLKKVGASGEETVEILKEFGYGVDEIKEFGAEGVVNIGKSKL